METAIRKREELPGRFHARALFPNAHAVPCELYLPRVCVRVCVVCELQVCTGKSSRVRGEISYEKSSPCAGGKICYAGESTPMCGKSSPLRGEKSSCARDRAGLEESVRVLCVVLLSSIQMVTPPEETKKSKKQ